MELQFIRIDEKTLINVRHIVAVVFHERIAGNALDKNRIDISTVSGFYQCYDPYIGDVAAVIADYTV